MVTNPAGRATGSEKSAIQNPLAISIPQAATVAGISRSTLYEQIRAGNVASMKIGKRRLIRISDLDAWLESLAKPAA